MASRWYRWKIGWIALLAMPGLLLAQPTPSVVAPSGQAATFDQILQRLIGPDSLSAIGDTYDTDLERLRAALPAGDQARDARFCSEYCGS